MYHLSLTNKLQFSIYMQKCINCLTKVHFLKSSKCYIEKIVPLSLRSTVAVAGASSTSFFIASDVFPLATVSKYLPDLKQD